nr:EOG090X0H9E [Eulimnadia texana]
MLAILAEPPRMRTPKRTTPGVQQQNFKKKCYFSFQASRRDRTRERSSELSDDLNFEGFLPVSTKLMGYADDEDSDGKSTMSYKERRREAHTQAEQKRRDAIKKGYDMLQDLVPMCRDQDPVCGYKLSKATVLQRSIDYIQFLQQQKKKQEEELAALRKEVIALQIMKSNYDQIVSAHQNQPGHPDNRVSEEVKFQVFQTIMENLFQTFDSMVSVSSFMELSSSVIAWVEEHCKPQMLRNLVTTVLHHFGQK